MPQIGATRISADDKDLKNLLVNIAPFPFPLVDSLMGQLRSGSMDETDVNRSIESILNLDKLVRKYNAQKDPEPVGFLVMLKHLAQLMREEGTENELPQVLKDLGLPINKTSKKKSASKGFGKT